MSGRPIGAPTFFTGGIAAAVRRHRWVALSAWLVISIVTIGACAVVGANEDLADTGRGDSAEAIRIFDERFGSESGESSGSETIVFRHASLTVDDDEYEAVVASLLADLRSLRATTSRTVGGTEVVSHTRVFPRR